MSTNEGCATPKTKKWISVDFAEKTRDWVPPIKANMACKQWANNITACDTAFYGMLRRWIWLVEKYPSAHTAVWQAITTDAINMDEGLA